MNQISLMTMNMTGRLFFMYRIQKEIDTLQDGYDEIMEMAEAAGYPAVDVTAWETGLLGTDFVMETLKKHHLRVSSYICFGAFAAMDEAGFAGRVEDAKKAADEAERLGTDVIMLVTQASDDIDRYTKDEIRAQQVRHWREIVPYIKGKGMHAVIEDFPDLRLGLCRAEDVRSVLDQVPGLELVYDSGNMILEKEDPVRFLDLFEGRIGYVHLKDMRKAPADHPAADHDCDGTPMCTAPTGTGMICLPDVIEKLVKMGYKGSMTVEFAVNDDGKYPESLARSRSYVEEILKDVYSGAGFSEGKEAL